MENLVLAGYLRARQYWPVADAALPLLVYFHGGRFISGDLESHDPICRMLAIAANCRVLAVDYRLAPEHRFPAAAEDARLAVEWALGQGIAVAVAGDSAGANLAAGAALAHRGAALRCQVLIYPMIDATCSEPSYTEFAEGYGPGAADMKRGWREYLPEGADPRDPLASPLFAADLKDAPPAWVLTAEYDTLRDEGEAYARRLGDRPDALPGHDPRLLHHAGNSARGARSDGRCRRVPAQPLVERVVSWWGRQSLPAAAFQAACRSHAISRSECRSRSAVPPGGNVLFLNPGNVGPRPMARCRCPLAGGYGSGHVAYDPPRTEPALSRVILECRPALHPFHRVAFHIVKSPGVREFAAYGFRPLVGIVEIPQVPVVDLLAPVMVSGGSRAGGIFPFGFQRHARANRLAVRLGVVQAHEHHRLAAAQRKAGRSPVAGFAGLLGIGPITGGLDELAELAHRDFRSGHLKRAVELDAFTGEALGARQCGVAPHDERSRRNLDESRLLRGRADADGGDHSARRIIRDPRRESRAGRPCVPPCRRASGRGVCWFGQRSTVPSKANFEWPQQVQ